MPQPSLKPEDKTTKLEPEVQIAGDKSQYILVEPLDCIDQYVDGNNQTFYIARLKKIK